MIEDPDRWAPAYAEAGGASVTFHVEAAPRPACAGPDLRAAGARAGMALKPGTAVRALRGPAARARHGAGDDRRARLRRPVVHGRPDAQGARRSARPCGATAARSGCRSTAASRPQTIEQCAEAGADVFVAGSAVYGAEDAAAAVDELRAPGGAPPALAARPLHWRRLLRPGGAACTGGRALAEPARSACGVRTVTGRRVRADGRVRILDARAPGSVQFRTGGDSPRPGRSQRPVDQVELQDRR